jgi:hypothetical protein
MTNTKAAQSYAGGRGTSGSDQAERISRYTATPENNNSGMRGNPLPTKSGLCESGETSSRPRFGLEGERDEGHLALLLMLGTVAPLLAEEVRVRGHYRSDGTYVQPHMRSTPGY